MTSQSQVKGTYQNEKYTCNCFKVSQQISNNGINNTFVLYNAFLLVFVFVFLDFTTELDMVRLYHKDLMGSPDEETSVIW